MNVFQCIKIKLKKDLLNDFPDDEDLIERKIMSLTEDQIYDTEYIYSNSCEARVWNNHRGTRCSNLKCDTQYCKTHQKIIQKYGKLTFGNYFEERPSYKDGKKLYWYDYSEKDELNILMNYQNMKILNIISKLEDISKSILYFKYRQIMRNY